jgi:site-specific DNA-methyltransferase (adenine-specific)
VAEPYWQHEHATLYGGDALALLASLPDASVDAVITDPPYSSGGMVRGDRTTTTFNKYARDNSAEDTPNFTGDNRDQRAYGYWCSLWLAECLRVTKPGGVCLLFTDWRQLPATSDAIQAGGWIWRGIVPWFKPGARPQAGRFANQCEYVIWGTAGARFNGGWGWTLPGFFQAQPPRDREHMTQKPLSVMRELVKIAPKGGTTGAAAVIEGRSFIGAELTPHYQQVARERIEASIVGYRDRGSQGVLEVAGA